MDRLDSLVTRRAAVGAIGTVLASSGVVYGASRLDTESDESTGLPFHGSSESTGFGIDLDGHPIMGAPDAALDMYYWGDYQCPFCRRFEQNTLPEIIEKHVRTGTVRIVFIEYPYLSDASMTAAVMDRCVWRQVRDERPSRYWPWHSAVFDAQGEKNSGWASRPNLLEITRGVQDVDATAVDACMRKRGYGIEQEIGTDVEQASSFGIRGSPGFVLYDPTTQEAGKLVGAQPHDRFDAAISKLRNE
ncbi:DsbA family protein [Haloplanus litoreus]|uniref:DsbA family protein n=1 Tax=Haloplanus litoreus TaxID=767515 RepID=UPI003607A8C4